MSESADRVEMHFLRSLLFIHSLGPSSSERRPVACSDKFCVVQFPVSLVGTLVFTILVFVSGVQIMYTSCCCQNHLILIKNTACLRAMEEIIRYKQMRVISSQFIRTLRLVLSSQNLNHVTILILGMRSAMPMREHTFLGMKNYLNKTLSLSSSP